MSDSDDTDDHWRIGAGSLDRGRGVGPEPDGAVDGDAKGMGQEEVALLDEDPRQGREFTWNKTVGFEADIVSSALNTLRGWFWRQQALTRQGDGVVSSGTSFSKQETGYLVALTIVLSSMTISRFKKGTNSAP